MSVWRDGLSFDKDPQSIEPFGFDWTEYLAELASSVTVSSSVWRVSDPTMTLASPSIVTGGKKTQVMVSGGRIGTQYRLTNHIVTSSGVEDDRTILLNVRQR